MPFLSSFYGTTVSGRQDLLGCNTPRCPIIKFRPNKWVTSATAQSVPGETGFKSQNVILQEDLAESKMSSITSQDPISVSNDETETTLGSVKPMTDSANLEPVSGSMPHPVQSALAPSVSPLVISADEYIADHFKSISFPNDRSSYRYTISTVRGADQEDPKFQEIRARYRIGQRSSLVKLAEYFENCKRAIEASESSYEEFLACRFQAVASAINTGVVMD